ncbi:hypothetical protein KXR83_26470 [Williamsia muralis]|uniref:relaxase/mobilization nuclease domain-containing protein n=1 Tax=Williamsia marianensis TaxID=85044 RepID=UPI003F164272
MAGNVAGRSWKERSYAIDDHVKRTNPKLTNPIIRTSLRIAPEDRNLTDREWRQIANEYVGKMGFADSPWEAVRHADDHIHLTMSRVKWDGTVVDQWKDKLRAQDAVRGIERSHNLVDASKRYDRDLPQVSGNDRERAERLSQKAGRQIDPERLQLRSRIAEAERASNGTREGFESELERRGVTHRANVSRPTERNPEGRMNGYSYGLDGHTDKAGEQVWFKGSALGKQYGWQQQQQRLSERNDDHKRRSVSDVKETNARRETPPQEFEGKTARSGVAAAPSSNSVDQAKANETAAREDRREAARSAHRHDREQPMQTAAPSRQDTTTGHTQAGESQERQQEDRNAARGAMSREDAREAARAAIREREQARAEFARTDASKDSSGQRSSPRDEESRRTTDDRKSRSSDRATEPERIPSRPMSRDDARAVARQRAEDRTQPERPENHYDKSEAGGATKGQGASAHEVTSTSTEGASPMKPGHSQSSSDNKMTREEAQEEARRQAQERDEKREQDRERETEQER